VPEHRHRDHDRSTKQLATAGVVELAHLGADLHAQVRARRSLRDDHGNVGGRRVISQSTSELSIEGVAAAAIGWDIGDSGARAGYTEGENRSGESPNVHARSEVVLDPARFGKRVKLATRRRKPPNPDIVCPGKGSESAPVASLFAGCYYVQYMALPAHVLERLSPAFSHAGVRFAQPAEGSVNGLSFGLPELDRIMPDGGLPRGSVVELCASGEGALGTSLALRACAQAQAELRERAGRTPWCAFVDPSGTLYGPGVLAAGVELSRLLVVRSPLAALSRVALRLAESEAFAVVVVDLAGVVGERVGVSLGTWPRVVRRLAMAIEGTGHSVLLLTRAADRRPLPLPVAQRLEVTRPSADKLTVRIAKDQRGRVSSPHTIAWTGAGVWSAPQNEVAEVERVRRLA
jgi:recombination protein RecA